MAEIVPFLPNLFTLPKGSAHRPSLIGNQCAHCQTVFFPSRPWCVKCFQGEMKPVKLSARGTLYTFTICRMPLPHIAAPYAIGWVELPEGVRVFSLLDVDLGNIDLAAGFKPAPTEQAGPWSPLRIGTEVELTAGKLRDGENGAEIWCYKFKPVG